MGMEMMEARPIARTILVHTPAEAKAQRGYVMPQLDRPNFPSEKSPQHQLDYDPLHTAQHESIERAIKQKVLKRCVQLLEHQRKLDREIEDLKKAGKTENLDELLSRSDKSHAVTAMSCKTPE